MSWSKSSWSFSSSFSALQVFERMSEECIAGLVTAQQQTTKFGLPSVEPPLVLAGCVDHPESAALSNTLARYGITWRRVETALSSLYVAKTDTSRRWLFKSDKPDDDDRPFSAATKYTLQRAGKLADSMQCPIVSSHHVFLALLDYQEGRLDGNRGTIAATATDANDAWNVLLKCNVLAANTTALDICTTLVTYLTLEPTASAKTSKELVSAGSGSGSGSSDGKATPTLAQVGIDLTDQARLGLLDVVHGRDAEIRAALRTLLRRRKNNVVLIGEAGVGTYSV
jgi:ATP-dependent Clp protease ATP-binding subunit ClpA